MPSNTRVTSTIIAAGLCGALLSAAIRPVVALDAVSHTTAPRATVDRPADDAQFLTTAALDPSSLPGQMQLIQQGFVGIPDVARGSDDAAAALSGAGFEQGYVQAFRASDPLVALSGAPAGVGDVIIVFTDADGASAWNQYVEQNSSALEGAAASAQGVDVNITDSTPWDLSGLGQEASAVELHGDATVAGFPTEIYIEVANMRRDRVQYTALVVGLTPQRVALKSVAATLDSSVANSLSLLNQ